MLYCLGLLNDTNRIALDNCIACLLRGFKLPDCVTGEGRNLDTARQVIADLLHDGFQRSLDTVEDTADQTGPEFYGERSTGGLDRLAGLQSRCFLVYLDGSTVTMHLDDLADQTLVTDTYNVKKVRITHSLCNYQWSGDLHDRPFAHFAYSFYLLTVLSKCRFRLPSQLIWRWPSCPFPRFP